MTISGICYLIGAGLTTGAVPSEAGGLAMLIIGRIMLGVGVGFANSVSVFSSPVIACKTHLKSPCKSNLGCF